MAANPLDPCSAALAALQPALPLGIAYSGGADSTALLHAAACRWPQQVVALHVHHGLQAAADGFAAHAAAACAALGVPLRVARVDARHAPGDSPEDAARQARYAALATLAAADGIREVALAQHADDQAETVLLALSRGAGLPGLAAMPARFERHGTVFLRPLLAVPGPAIRRWLAAASIGFVDDPTNTDLGFTRNRIRHQLLPAMEQTFPQFRQTFARSARHAAEAQALLAELGAADLAAVGNPPRIRALQQLNRPRQANVLRTWLRTEHATVPSARQLDELLRQVAACTTRGHAISLKVGAGFVARHGALLDWYNPAVSR